MFLKKIQFYPWTILWWWTVRCCLYSKTSWGPFFKWPALEYTYKWNVKKANSKLFFIRRLKDLRASQSTLVEIYKLFICQGLEFAAPLWTSSLSKKNIKDLEKLQARATDIICGYENRLSYEQRLGVLSLLSLKTRRWAITERFAVDCSKNPKFQHLFKERPYQNTRSKQKYCEIQARTKRYASSPIPTYISLVNKISQD